MPPGTRRREHARVDASPEGTPISDDDEMTFETPRGRSIDAAHVGTAHAPAPVPAPSHGAVRVDSQGYYLLSQTEYSSKYLLGPEDFKEVGGTANEPATIGLVVLILKNDWNHKVGKAKFKIVHIDSGDGKKSARDGKKTHLYVDNDSDLYRIKFQGSTWDRGAIARLHDVSFELKSGRPIQDGLQILPSPCSRCVRRDIWSL
ncbi:protein tyrosine phosphatase [Moesziomyces antarcticus T-34]|uniref:Protein tyrosine phosphatase n=1 Tax=Pseudozyma antarctica (strain T-34) TaxID=1151754 RepID=M9LUS4_PSEA3|nr:protein tyrosine phosphatase [Moesziomyces antarcticus T-34]